MAALPTPLSSVSSCSFFFFCLSRVSNCTVFALPVCFHDLSISLSVPRSLHCFSEFFTTFLSSLPSTLPNFSSTPPSYPSYIFFISISYFYLSPLLLSHPIFSLPFSLSLFLPCDIFVCSSLTFQCMSSPQPALGGQR